MVLLIRKKHLLAAVTGAALAVGRSGCKPRPSAGHGIGDSQHRAESFLGRRITPADGGAVSDSGVAESGVNLAITQRLGDVLSLRPYGGADAGGGGRPVRRRT